VEPIRIPIQIEKLDRMDLHVCRHGRNSRPVPGYEATFWAGFVAPKNTPSEIVEKLNREINAALADPKIKGRFTDLGGTPFPSSSAQFGNFVAQETEKWAKVVKFAGMKPD
jgi:tripartite-type tricarboxylate transporter receptor subunit TctC